MAGRDEIELKKLEKINPFSLQHLISIHLFVLIKIHGSKEIKSVGNQSKFMSMSNLLDSPAKELENHRVIWSSLEGWEF
ncbi:hypothetical protein MKX03_037381 [Papaver bracteatum]|nr:hypothetical protein MKX03_037381 [Papaver bracteatum]